jgi:signal transduction histidine kinase
MPGRGFVSFDVHTDRPGARFGDRDLLRTVAEGTAGTVGDAFLRDLVRHVALAFDAKFAFVAEATDPSGGHVRVLSGWHEGDWMDEPFEYDTRGKPCALVVERSVVAFPEALTKRFPEARPAIEMGLESYLAICLRAADGTHLGHMAVMDAGPMAADDDDVAAMRIFASRAAAELERRHQAAALRRSRARVIEAADSERRRVGRDLHDGAQQRLVAVANLLKLAQRRLDGGDAPVDVLRLACDELGAAQTELRDLARGLHPVALSERGLSSALESLTVGCEIPVTLDVAAGDLPDDVERAAYFIVCESVTNARKYAGAEALRVRVARVADAVLVEIVDDGSGGADPSSGTGLRGLADRVDALGGRLEVESPPGAGTRVSARLPLLPLA